MNLIHSFPNKLIYILIVLNLPMKLGSQTGIYSVQGDFIKTSGTTFIELKNLSGPGTGHDQVAVSGDSEIGGFLNITLNGYSPSNTHQFEIFAFGGTLTGTYALVTFPSTMSAWSIDYGVLNPGKITIYGPNSPLPVELVSFTVTADGNDNVLNWRTASEVNNDYFDIEYSSDGKQFNKVGKIPSLGQYSSSIQEYQFIDKDVKSGIAYYRLRQVDLDGVWENSHIVSVTNDESKGILQVYPNPSYDQLHFTKGVHFIDIIDAMGKQVYSGEVTNQKVNISNVPNGQYNIRFNKSDESTKIIIIK